MRHFVLGLLLSLNVFAGADTSVLVRGVVAGSFDDKMIKVKDTYGQIYSLPRSLFPKDFVPESGKSFSVQVPEIYLDKLTVEKPKKK